MKLLVFPHSHFCEKARWALDYKGVDFEVVAVLPGIHLRTIRKIAPNSSVPVLVDNDEVIQDADAIVTYLENKFPEPSLMPNDGAEGETHVALEREMDARLGVNLRQILYSDLLDNPAFLQMCFTHTMPWWKRNLFPFIYPTLKNRIYAAYVKSDEAVETAAAAFQSAMDELAGRLNGRSYLVGDRFSRVDLAIASMLSILVLPAEHPFPWHELPESGADTLRTTYADHPVFQWVQTIYRHHRAPAAR